MKKLNKQTIIVFVACLLLIGGTIGFLVWYDKKKKSTATGEEKQTGDGPGISTGNTVKKVFPLKLNSNNSYVKDLQKKLNAALAGAIQYNNYAIVKNELPVYNGKTITALVVDGIFGNQTLAVVRWWFKDVSKTNVKEDEFYSI